MTKTVKRRVIIGLGAIVLVWACGVAILVVLSAMHPKMSLDYRRVSSLSRPVVLLKVSHNLDWENLAAADRRYADNPGIPLYSGSVPGSPGAPVAVRPDGSGFFVGTFTEIVEFDSDVNVVRRIPLVEFFPKNPDTQARGSAAASADRVWMTVHIPGERLAGFTFEWNPSDPPITRRVGPGNPSGRIAVDPLTRRVFIPGATGLAVWQQPNIPSDVLHEKYRAVEAIEDSAARRQAWQDLRAAGETTTERLFLGKWRNDMAVLELSDMVGRTRLRLSVAADGTPAIEILDEEGNATNLAAER